jgi:CheY-like chemotaxis protein
VLPILVVAPAVSRCRIVTILRQAGYFVAEADSSETALKLMNSVSPELILISIVMHDGNGLEIAARLRRNPSFHSSLPIILLGSVTPIGIHEEPLTSLVSGYLNIDVPPNDLLATICSHLTTNGSNSQ